MKNTDNCLPAKSMLTACRSERSGKNCAIVNITSYRPKAAAVERGREEGREGVGEWVTEISGNENRYCIQQKYGEIVSN